MAKSLTYEFWLHVKNNSQLSTNGGKFCMGAPIQFIILPIGRILGIVKFLHNARAECSFQQADEYGFTESGVRPIFLQANLLYNLFIFLL